MCDNHLFSSGKKIGQSIYIFRLSIFVKGQFRISWLTTVQASGTVARGMQAEPRDIISQEDRPGST